MSFPGHVAEFFEGLLAAHQLEAACDAEALIIQAEDLEGDDLLTSDWSTLPGGRTLQRWT